MTDNVNSTNPHANRMALVLIFAIPVLVILASTLLYYLADSRVVNLGAVNRGQLITPPIEISGFGLLDSSGQPLDYSQPEPRWTYMMFGGARCEGTCERILYLTGQTHKLLGKKINQVQRMYVSVDGEVDASLQQLIDQQQQGLHLAYADGETVKNLLAGLDVDPLADESFFLVDPRGWVMMYYVASDSEPLTLSNLSKDMIKDIKRLIP